MRKRSLAGSLVLASLLVAALVQPAGAAAVRVSVRDSSATEGNQARIAIALSRKSTRTVKVSYVTLNGTAKAGTDYNAKSGRVAFLPGTVKKVITISTKEDTLDEANETFFVKLSSPLRATLLRAKAKATITDDDAMPTLSVTDNSATESDFDVVPISFDVSLSAPSGRTAKVVVGWGTEGTATHGVDFDANTQTLTFAPGVVQQTAVANILPDDLDEEDETFLVLLDNAVNATTTGVHATGTILDDDNPLPTLVINEVDYDQPINPDSTEFVELYNGSDLAFPLANIALVFVSGSTSTEYSRVNLSSAGASVAAGSRLTVASSMVTVAPGGSTLTFAAATDNIQNGEPDGILLIDTSTCSMIDALSYEGSTINAQVAGCATQFNLVEGMPTTATDSTAVQGSLIRNPDGTDTGNALSDWAFTTTATPGAANVP